MEQMLKGVILCSGEELGVDKNHQSGLMKKYFDMVASGAKIYEIRVNDDKRKCINKGDTYAFGLVPDRKMWIKKTVEDKFLFSNFVELCEVIPFKAAGFSSKEEMLKAYTELYEEEEVKKYGIVAFKLK